MNNVFNIFSTREIALTIWFIILLIYVSLGKHVRDSIVGIFKVFLDKKIVIALSTMLIYILLVILILSYIRFWDMSLLKDTIIWILFSGIVLFMNTNKVKNVNYFSKLIKDNIKIIVIFEFLSNLYTLSLLGELIFIPIVSFFSIVGVFAENSSKQKENHKKVDVLCKNILGLIGLGMIGYVIYKTITEYNLLLSVSNLKSFLLPILLVILTLPYFYFFALFMRYETLFVRVNRLKYIGEGQIKKVKMQILISANISLTKLFRVNRDFMSLKSTEDIQKQIKKIAKKPLHKKVKIGNEAKIELFNDIEKSRRLLSKIGIGEFSEWHNIGNSFQSITPYYELSDSYINSYIGLPNNIACYLSGKETYIEQLNLTLSIHNRGQKESALFLLKECIEKIFSIFNIRDAHDIFESIDNKKELRIQTEIFLYELNIYKYENMDVWEFILETK